jgi:hypothetical protein
MDRKFLHRHHLVVPGAGRRSNRFCTLGVGIPFLSGRELDGTWADTDTKARPASGDCWTVEAVTDESSFFVGRMVVIDYCYA